MLLFVICSTLRLGWLAECVAELLDTPTGSLQPLVNFDHFLLWVSLFELNFNNKDLFDISYTLKGILRNLTKGTKLFQAEKS